MTRQLFAGIKTLSAQDYEDDPGWGAHVSLHATNAQRAAATMIRLDTAARAARTFGYQWRARLPPAIANQPPQIIERVYEIYQTEMTQQYLHGAPVMLAANKNVPLGVTNGSIGIAAGIKFKLNDQPLVEQAEILAQREGRSVAILPEGVRPVFVQALLPLPPHMEGNRGALPADGDLVEREDESTMWRATMVACKSDRKLALGNVPNAGRGFGAQRQATVMTLHTFDFTLAFALTVHKSQGLTLRHVVLDVARSTAVAVQNVVAPQAAAAAADGAAAAAAQAAQPARAAVRRKAAHAATWTYEMIYVAVSRAAADADIRVLPRAAGETVTHMFSNGIGKATAEYLKPEHWPVAGGTRMYDAVGAAAAANRRDRE
jgi:hypothetical protein